MGPDTRTAAEAGQLPNRFSAPFARPAACRLPAVAAVPAGNARRPGPLPRPAAMVRPRLFRTINAAFYSIMRCKAA